MPAAFVVDPEERDVVALAVECSEDRGGRNDRYIVLDRASSKEQSDPQLIHHPPGFAGGGPDRFP
jgi:hypothetical protein